MMESEAFDYLYAPLERVAGSEVPMPYSITIERLAVPKLKISLGLHSKLAIERNRRVPFLSSSH